MCLDNTAADRASSFETLIRQAMGPQATTPACVVPTATVAGGSRRRRLWELESHAHCPVVGVCLPLPALRRLATRVLGGQPMADDYELHCGVVSDCKLRTTMAQAVQRELDQRYALAVRQAALAKSTAALITWWESALARQDIAGPLWATLTHPRCTPALEHRLLGQVHMLQHQAGMARRADLDRLETLSRENTELNRALSVAQQRSMQLSAHHAQAIEELQRQTMQLRADLIASHTVIAQLRQAQRELEDNVPMLKDRLALTHDNQRLMQRIETLEAALQNATRSGRLVRAHPEEPRLPAGACLDDTETTPAEAMARLDNRTVLCVGGRPAVVPLYRHIVEGTGGRFLHHDGGSSDSSARLDATLSAADLVICQTGCISHNAYWRVKDHCKRTGKRCVFVESPSTARLKRALVALAPATQEPAREAVAPLSP